MELVLSELIHHDENEGAVGVVTLNDPARRNALSTQLVSEFITAFDELEASLDVHAIVVTGAAPTFCAGADLSSLAPDQNRPQSKAEREAELRRVYSAFLRVSECALPTIAAVNGPAVGAGMNLALACDVRIASNRSRFDTRFLNLGLHPGGGHTFLLDRAVGPQAASAMVLFGEILSGEEAERRGLAWRCVDEGELRTESLALARRATTVPRALLTRTKETLREAPVLDRHADAVDLEIVAQTWSLGEPFFFERLAALRAQVSKSTPK
jgi:enoyl-CoA hydratase